ncbi:polynucleotide adenylyltransferase [candidate division GN15 bacterium]|uniref:Polynucleotide adenylyltransferase n=1 Tax=candidate division GN15 bacterium TaxID=2072418 RepID=A0A855X4L1_9BACT|nr:MAG: polynucleotide adenylyltransferase [candidate division GN15 bacterium]
MMCTLSQETIDEILRCGRIYEVGGVVRDRFLTQDAPAKDRDYLVTGIHYDELTAILRQFGKVDLVGKSFGVIKFTQRRTNGYHTFDISLPRREHSTGVGHKDFAVTYDPSIPVEMDLTRRDFTINAMAWALDSNRLVDPLNGMTDLKHRQIRMTSEESFTEDPLRMLRAIQFAARFEFEIEPETFAAITRHATLVATVSAERIAEELNKLLTLAKRPSDGFRLMHQSGLLIQVLPELEACVGVEQPGGYHRYDVFEHILRTIDATQPKLRLRLAALFHDIRKPQHRRLVEDGATFYGHEAGGARTTIDVMNRLRYSKDLSAEVATLVDRHMFTTEVSDKGLRRLIRRVGLDLIFDLLALRRADVFAQGMGGTTEDVDVMERRINEEIERKAPFGLKDLALSGSDIMTLFDIPPGPMVGRILDHLMEKVLDQPEDNTREKLEQYARDLYAGLKMNNDAVNDKDIA